jgi:hypothetical protein
LEWLKEVLTECLKAAITSPAFSPQGPVKKSDFLTVNSATHTRMAKVGLIKSASQQKKDTLRRTFMKLEAFMIDKVQPFHISF